MIKQVPGFLATYKKTIISGIIALALAGSGTFTVFVHNAYADDRYVQKTDDLRQRIQNIDNALFEIDQEISFAITDQQRAKWTARKAYYKRLKDALVRKLKASTT